MEQELTYIGESNTAEILIDRCIELVKKRGATQFCYHFTPPFKSQLCKRMIPVFWGYPPEWVTLYSKYEFRKNDPIPNYVMRSGVSTSWQIAIDSQKLSTAQTEFVKVMRQHGLLDGMAIPMFGANGHESYTGMNLQRTITPDDDPIFRQLVALGQVAHRRLFKLLKVKNGIKVSLSPRETEVLQWIVRGKSNADIATLMSISPTTVDTFVRRIFAKLKVNDRIAACLAGIARGLVRR